MSLAGRARRAARAASATAATTEAESAFVNSPEGAALRDTYGEALPRAGG